MILRILHSHERTFALTAFALAVAFLIIHPNPVLKGHRHNASYAATVECQPQKSALNGEGAERFRR